MQSSRVQTQAPSSAAFETAAIDRSNITNSFSRSFMLTLVPTHGRVFAFATAAFSNAHSCLFQLFPMGVAITVTSGTIARDSVIERTKFTAWEDSD